MPDGEKSTGLPERATNPNAVVVLRGSSYNRILDQIDRITPRGDGRTTKVTPRPGGSIVEVLGAAQACQLQVGLSPDGDLTQSPGTANGTSGNGGGYTGVPAPVTGSPPSNGVVYIEVSYQPTSPTSENTSWEVIGVDFLADTTVPPSDCPEWDETSETWSPATGTYRMAWAVIDDGRVTASNCGPVLIVVCGPCDVRVVPATESP